MDTNRLDKALDRLQRLAAVGSPIDSRRQAEYEYGAAYQQLVKLGERPRLRAKYTLVTKR